MAELKALRGGFLDAPPHVDIHRVARMVKNHAPKLGGICLLVPGPPQWAFGLNRLFGLLDHLGGLTWHICVALFGVLTPSVFVVGVEFFAGSLFGDFLARTYFSVFPFLCSAATSVVLLAIFAKFNFPSFHRLTGLLRTKNQL